MTHETPGQAVGNAIANMQSVLRDAGRIHFSAENDCESALCALICILDPKSHVYSILESLPGSDSPLDIPDVLNALAHIGYVAQPIELKTQDTDSRLLPCLLLDRNDCPVVLMHRVGDDMMVWRSGQVETMPVSALPGHAGRAWLFKRFDEHGHVTSRFMREGSGFSWFRTVFERFHGTLMVIFGAGFVLNLVALATPLFIMAVYDRVIASGSLLSLPMLAIGAALGIALEWGFRHVRAQALAWLSARLDNIVGNAVFAHLIGLSPDMIERASVAAQIARIKTFESVRDFFSGSIFLSVIELPFVILSLLAISIIAGQLVLVPLCMTGLFGILFWAILRQVRISIRLAAKASSARQQFSIETFEKIHGIRSCGLTGTWHAKFRDLSGREMMAHFYLNWLGTVAETVSNALIILSAVLTAAVGTHLIWAGNMTTGALVATMILVWRVLIPFYSLSSMVPRLEQLRNSILQVNKLMDLDTEDKQAGTAARLSSIHGAITFSRASCVYDEDDPVFSDLSFQAQPGDLVIVTGDNGTGKTSLLKLIKRMHELKSGAIQIDGFDIRQLDAGSLRRQIAYVPQLPSFYRASILDNLRFGNPLATREEAENALRLADVWNGISQMPLGIDTIISHCGQSADDMIDPDPELAGRLALARSYLHNSPILLIDELSNTLLDSQAGHNLRDYLIRCKGKRTVVMVNYREDFIRMADTVVLLSRIAAPLAGPASEIFKTIRQREAA